MVFGVRRIMKREGYNLPPGDRAAAINMATRAFGVGTLLCLSTFAGAAAIFIGATGITTVKQFGTFAEKIVHGTGLQPTLEKIDRENEEFQKLDREFERTVNEYLKPSKRESFTNEPINGDGPVTSDVAEKSIVQSLREKIRKKFQTEDKKGGD